MNYNAVVSERAWHARNEQRLLAESVACSYCGAQVGEPCRNARSGGSLAKAPAHPVRLRAAEVPL